MISSTHSMDRTVRMMAETTPIKMEFILILTEGIKAQKPAVQSRRYPPKSPTNLAEKDTFTLFYRPAKVISTSYSYNEADLTPQYTARQCAEYAKLGLMGVTVLYSSGDYGVAGNGGLCLDVDGSQSATGKIFNPRCVSLTACLFWILTTYSQLSRNVSLCHKCRCYTRSVDIIFLIPPSNFFESLS